MGVDFHRHVWPDVAVAEIGPYALERELRGGHDIVVLDTRDPEAFAAWRLDAGASTVVNIPEDVFAGDVDRAFAMIPRSARLRIICTAGNSSRRVAAALADRRVASLSVRGGMVGWSRVVQHDEVPLDGPIRVIQFRREARGCLSYLLVAGHEALVVDPGPDIEPYLFEAGSLGVQIVRVFDTHIHADHLSGARQLAGQTGAVLHLPAAALERGCRYAERVLPVADGAVFKLDRELIRVVELPGHTSDMTGLLLGEDALIAGDSLFLDSVARPDLELGDDGAVAGARRLHRTLRERIAQLPDTTALLPAHYAGGRVDGPVVATLGSVRGQLPELALDEERFVQHVLAELPDRPANYLEIIGVNLGPRLPDQESARLEVGANNCAATIPRPPDRP